MLKTLVTLFAAAWLAAGCNTLEGVGKDVKKAGSAIEEAAKKK
jgi:predicted small secreted protein